MRRHSEGTRSVRALSMNLSFEEIVSATKREIELAKQKGKGIRNYDDLDPYNSLMTLISDEMADQQQQQQQHHRSPRLHPNQQPSLPVTPRNSASNSPSGTGRGRYSADVIHWEERNFFQKMLAEEDSARDDMESLLDSIRNTTSAASASQSASSLRGPRSHSPCSSDHAIPNTPRRVSWQSEKIELRKLNKLHQREESSASTSLLTPGTAGNSTGTGTSSMEDAGSSTSVSAPGSATTSTLDVSISASTSTDLAQHRPVVDEVITNQKGFDGPRRVSFSGDAIARGDSDSSIASESSRNPTGWIPSLMELSQQRFITHLNPSRRRSSVASLSATTRRHSSLATSTTPTPPTIPTIRDITDFTEEQSNLGTPQLSHIPPSRQKRPSSTRLSRPSSASASTTATPPMARAVDTEELINDSRSQRLSRILDALATQIHDLLGPLTAHLNPDSDSNRRRSTASISSLFTPKSPSTVPPQALRRSSAPEQSSASTTNLKTTGIDEPRKLRPHLRALIRALDNFNPRDTSLSDRVEAIKRWLEPIYAAVLRSCVIDVGREVVALEAAIAAVTASRRSSKSGLSVATSTTPSDFNSALSSVSDGAIENGSRASEALFELAPTFSPVTSTSAFGDCSKEVGSAGLGSTNVGSRSLSVALSVSASSEADGLGSAGDPVVERVKKIVADLDEAQNWMASQLDLGDKLENSEDN
ncbi:hypothetical protein HDU76_005685 [Blyttiomyces sp. JEL0837]|nr:hypothetical protein HDU76_005685 [Blyttiomyces sp. JEL0837]